MMRRLLLTLKPSAAAAEVGGWGAMVTGLGCAVAGATGGGWDDAANWTEASATAVALGAAIVAGRYVAKQLDLELQREKSRLDADLSAQASLVAAWPTGNLGDGFDSNLYEQTVIYESFTGMNVDIRNASQVPVTDVAVRVTLEVSAAGTAQVASGLKEIAFLPPNVDPVAKTVLFVQAIECTVPVEADRLGQSDAVRQEISIDFTDASGIRWRRDRDGLERV